jgi:hypothetical protein
MRSLFISGTLVLACLFSPAYAGETREIDLLDGSTVIGEVVSLSNGIYTVKSPSLGTIRIEQSRIRTIRSGAAPAAAGATVSPEDTKVLQEKMLKDKDVLNLIQSLQQDPDFQKALQNPEIMKAVQAGDIATLQADPEFMKLLNNTTVRNIQKKVQ